MKKLLSSIILGASILGFSLSAQAGNLTLHGSTTVTSNVFEPFQGKLESATGLKLNVIGNGSSRGVEGLDTGKADIGMISSSVDSMKKKVPSAKWAEIKEHNVGIARIAFITHKSNPVKNLTLEQVTNILNGTIKNWSEVGGEDKAILIVTEYKGGGMRSTVEKKLLQKASFAGKMKELANGPQAVKVTSQVPNAFGVANGAIVNDTVAEVKTDKNIEQPLILLTKGAPNADSQKLIDAIRALNIN